MGWRTEKDSLGAVSVPEHAMYGAQTQRAILLYPTGHQKTLGHYPELVVAFLQVKQTAARVNGINGEIEPTLAGHIEKMCQNLIESFNPDYFPVHAFHGGGGIAANMNANEVIANCVNRQFYRQSLGSYTPAHPNDHINLNHSTSDSLQTASHMSVRQRLHGLMQSIVTLMHAFDGLIQAQQGMLKISRTCLQDAATIGFSDYWGGLKGSLLRHYQRFEGLLEELLSINLSANIIGRSGDCSASFAALCVHELNAITGQDYCKHANFYQCSQSLDTLVSVSVELDTVAAWLIKFAKDMRLMASGPNAGFAEIVLPPVQPGSSAIPGKINPTIPEYLAQCGMQVSGHCASVRLAHSHGELDYTPWGMLVVLNIIDAIEHLDQGITAFVQHCIGGLLINHPVNHRNVNSLIPLAIELKKHLGYRKASELLHQSGESAKLLQQQLQALIK